ncbi:MAG: DUF1232 domain-containing protein [Candidatus Cloacimonetes bacterium]|nr:DUF1232 domain-containing protein [Candidatus Cloacimonadota bacterium]
MTEKKETQKVINIDETKKEKIYDMLRRKVKNSVSDYFGDESKKGIEYVLLLPDFFILLWRLMQDKEVEKNKKIFIGAIIAYILLPIDLIPDFIPVIGFLDDLVLIAIGLNNIFVKTDKKILQKHWSGEGKILEQIEAIIKVGNEVLSEKMFGKITRLIDKFTK